MREVGMGFAAFGSGARGAKLAGVGRVFPARALSLQAVSLQAVLPRVVIRGGIADGWNWLRTFVYKYTISSSASLQVASCFKISSRRATWL